MTNEPTCRTEPATVPDTQQALKTWLWKRFVDPKCCNNLLLNRNSEEEGLLGWCEICCFQINIILCKSKKKMCVIFNHWGSQTCLNSVFCCGRTLESAVNLRKSHVFWQHPQEFWFTSSGVRSIIYVFKKLHRWVCYAARAEKNPCPG